VANPAVPQIRASVPREQISLETKQLGLVPAEVEGRGDVRVTGGCVLEHADLGVRGSALRDPGFNVGRRIQRSIAITRLQGEDDARVAGGRRIPRQTPPEGLRLLRALRLVLVFDSPRLAEGNALSPVRR